jgi:glycosyltransferase involved in cell wall biosynthesis
VTRSAAGPASVPRIFHLIDVAGTGGAETVFCQMVRFFDRRDENALIVLPGPGWIAEQLAGLRSEVRFVASRGSFSRQLLVALIQLVRQSRANIMVVHLLGSAVYAAVAGLLVRRAVIAVFHGALDFDAPGRMSGLKRWLLGLPHVHVVAVSASVKDALVAWGLQPDRVRIIANGVDTAAFRPVPGAALRDTLGLPADARIVGAVGNLHPVKGYELMLQAAALVVEVKSDVHFVVAGEGGPAYQRQLEQLRDQLGLKGHWHFLGFHVADAAHYCGLDVLVSAASSEGLPLSFLEAMACGIPIVATANEGSTRLLDDAQCGLGVPHGDPRALAGAILSVLGDAALARQLGGRGFQAVRQRYSLEATLGEYQHLIDALIRHPA